MIISTPFKSATKAELRGFAVGSTKDNTIGIYCVLLMAQHRTL